MSGKYKKINNLILNKNFDEFLILSCSDKEFYLREIVYKDYHEKLKQIIPLLVKEQFDFNFNESSLIRLAANYNSIECFNILLDYCDLHAVKEQCYRYSAENANIEILKKIFENKNVDFNIYNDYYYKSSPFFILFINKNSNLKPEDKEEALQLLLTKIDYNKLKEVLEKDETPSFYKVKCIEYLNNKIKNKYYNEISENLENKQNKTKRKI